MLLYEFARRSFHGEVRVRQKPMSEVKVLDLAAVQASGERRTQCILREGFSG